MKNIESDEDAYDEDELREEVGELPPRIQDLQVLEFEEDEEENNDAPTVVIDSSLEDDKDVAMQYRNMVNSGSNGSNYD